MKYIGYIYKESHHVNVCFKFSCHKICISCGTKLNVRQNDFFIMKFITPQFFGKQQLTVEVVCRNCKLSLENAIELDKEWRN